MNFGTKFCYFVLNIQAWDRWGIIRVNCKQRNQVWILTELDINFEHQCGSLDRSKFHRIFYLPSKKKKKEQIWSTTRSETEVSTRSLDCFLFHCCLPATSRQLIRGNRKHSTLVQFRARLAATTLHSKSKPGKQSLVSLLINDRLITRAEIGRRRGERWRLVNSFNFFPSIPPIISRQLGQPAENKLTKIANRRLFNLNSVFKLIQSTHNGRDRFLAGRTESFFNFQKYSLSSFLPLDFKDRSIDRSFVITREQV